MGISKPFWNSLTFWSLPWSFVSNIFHFWTPPNGILFDCFRTCKFGKSDPQLKFIVFGRWGCWLCWGGKPSGWEKRRNEKNWRYWQHSQSEVAKKKGVKTVSTCQLKSSTVRCYCCLAFMINEFATGCQQEDRLRISATHMNWWFINSCIMSIVSNHTNACIYVMYNTYLLTYIRYGLHQFTKLDMNVCAWISQVSTCTYYGTY